ncbi:MAG: zinc ribbon domain-containing protein [Desulfovibrio sp.]|nr:zinc ribbon domain-containing protein [Desulfovibrio sp.]
MPIYEYKCPKCGEVFEKFAKSSESHKDAICPKCGTESPRIISRTSFVLKGDGWYVSDYGYRKGIKEDSGAGAGAPAPTTSSKPAKQGEKSLVKKEDAPKKISAKKSENTAPKSAATDSGSKKSDAAS